MEPTHQTELDSRVLQAAVEKGLISQAKAEEVKGRAASEKTLATMLLIKDGVLTQHIVDNLAAPSGQAAEPQAIAGFKIQGRLGQGGMGTVYRALQVSMNRSVALKVIARQFAQDAAFCDRFLREARAAGAVNHPNVITCYDVGQADGWLYMALEIMTGGDAATAAKLAGGKLSEPQALRIIADGARGLTALKRAGLIHRDIKPANIFISEDGVSKLGDLGLARSTSGDDRMTLTGAAMGTPAFMSPEQASGESDLDIRTDIYALGATLFALLTGDIPYKGQSAFAVVAKVINDPVPDPRSFNPDLSDHAAAIVLTAMAKDRAQRYATPEAMIEDIERVLTGREPRHAQVTPRPAVALTQITPSRGQRQVAQTTPAGLAQPRSGNLAAMATVLTPPQVDPPPAARSRALLVAIAVLAIVVGLGAAGIVQHRRHRAGDAAGAQRFAVKPAPAQTAPQPVPVAVEAQPQAVEPKPPPIERDPNAALTETLALAPTQSAAPTPREQPRLIELPPERAPQAAPQPVPVAATETPPAPIPPTVVATPQPIEAPPAPAPATKPPTAVAPAPATKPPRIALRPAAQPVPKAAPIPPALLEQHRATLRERKLTAAVADAGDGGLAVQVDPGARDLAGLAGLPVTRLECEGCTRLATVAPLGGLPLRFLSLRGCTELKSLAGIDSLKLEGLDLTNCEGLEGDLSVLRAMPLTELSLAGCRNLTALAGIEGTRLATLDLTDCKRLTSVAAIAGLQLKQLCLQHCARLVDLSALAGMPLTQLDLTGCAAVTGLEPLRGLKLTRLALEDCKRLASLRGIDSPALTELTITRCAALKDLDGLQSLKLRRLALVRLDGLTSLAGLAGNPLQALEVTECGELLGDLTALNGLPLRTVLLRNCSGLTSLAGLEHAPLKQVTIVGCKRITDTAAAARAGVELNKE